MPALQHPILTWEGGRSSLNVHAEASGLKPLAEACMHMRVYMHVCAHTCVPACCILQMCTHMHVHVHECVSIHMCVHMHSCVPACCHSKTLRLSWLWEPAHGNMALGDGRSTRNPTQETFVTRLGRGDRAAWGEREG